MLKNSRVHCFVESSLDAPARIRRRLAKNLCQVGRATSLQHAMDSSVVSSAATLFQNGQYTEALCAYTAALASACEPPDLRISLLFNRSACYLKLVSDYHSHPPPSLCHFNNYCHVLSHCIHKPPFRHIPFPFSSQLHPQHPSPNMPIIFPPFMSCLSCFLSKPSHLRCP